MTEALRRAEDCDIMLNKYMAIDIHGEDALKVAEQMLGGKMTKCCTIWVTTRRRRAWGGNSRRTSRRW
eukprot:3499098-Pyramimonas_sp.AAC.1